MMVKTSRQIARLMMKLSGWASTGKESAENMGATISKVERDKPDEQINVSDETRHNTGNHESRAEVCWT